MLSYFRINDPYRLLGAFVILLVISIPRLIDYPGVTYPELKSILIGEKVHEGSGLYHELIDSVGPLTAWTQACIEWVFGRSLVARHILSLFVLFIQASFLGIIFNDKKVFPENTYIPSLIYVILVGFSFDMLSLSAELFGSVFILLALNSVFREMEFREQPDSTFKIGFYISLASLFLFSYAVFLPGAIIFLSVFTRSTWRKYSLMILGFVLPHILLISMYFMQNHLSSLWEFYYLSNFSWQGNPFITTRDMLTLGAFPLMFLVVSFFILNREARFTKYQSQLVQIMFFWMLFALAQVLYSKELSPQNFITLAPAFSFYITHCILLIRRRKFAEIGCWIFFLGTITVGYLAQYKQVVDVKYNKLIVTQPAENNTLTGKRVLQLDDDFSIYTTNTLGSGFLNWNLTSAIFRDPDNYDNVVTVYNSFKEDLPQVILDPNGYMDAYLKRIPALRNKYQRSRAGVYELIQQ